MGGSIIYAIGPGDASPYELYQVSPVNGAGTLVGPIFGFVGAAAMDAAPNGTLYSSGLDFFMNRELLTINRATGAPSLAHTVTGLPPNVGANDFAFRSDGTLFAIYGASSLYTLDTGTGAAALVGSPSTAASPQTLAFSNSGALYLSDGANLYTVNQSTGAASLVAPLTFDPSFGLTGPLIMHMKFDPANGTLYTSVYATVFGNGPSSLGAINVATGAVTRIGQTILALGPLAIVPTPEPSSWLLASAGLLGLGAYFGSRRSRNADTC